MGALSRLRPAASDPSSGGLPGQVFGPESSGKTTLAMNAIAAVQRDGGTAALIDAEHAFDPVYSKVRWRRAGALPPCMWRRRHGEGPAPPWCAPQASPVNHLHTCCKTAVGQGLALCGGGVRLCARRMGRALRRPVPRSDGRGSRCSVLIRGSLDVDS